MVETRLGRMTSLSYIHVMNLNSSSLIFGQNLFKTSVGIPSGPVVLLIFRPLTTFSNGQRLKLSKVFGRSSGSGHSDSSGVGLSLFSMIFPSLRRIFRWLQHFPIFSNREVIRWGFGFIVEIVSEVGDLFHISHVIRLYNLDDNFTDPFFNSLKSQSVIYIRVSESHNGVKLDRNEGFDISYKIIGRVFKEWRPRKHFV